MDGICRDVEPNDVPFEDIVDLARQMEGVLLTKKALKASNKSHRTATASNSINELQTSPIGC
jgi:hypothetical protein